MMKTKVCRRVAAGMAIQRDSSSNVLSAKTHDRGAINDTGVEDHPEALQAFRVFRLLRPIRTCDKTEGIYQDRSSIE